MASKISSALPAHLKPATLSSSNGNADGAFERSHHGKTQSHVVSHFPIICGDVASRATRRLGCTRASGGHVVTSIARSSILLFTLGTSGTVGVSRWSRNQENSLLGA